MSTPIREGSRYPTNVEFDWEIQWFSGKQRDVLVKRIIPLALQSKKQPIVAQRHTSFF